MLLCVAALPNADPVIEGVQPSYSVGEYISANCTSPRSYPPAEIAWFINGVKMMVSRNEDECVSSRQYETSNIVFIMISAIFTLDGTCNADESTTVEEDDSAFCRQLETGFECVSVCWWVSADNPFAFDQSYLLRSDGWIQLQRGASVAERFRLLASLQGEPGSIPGRIIPGFSKVGIAPDDAVGWQVFSEFSRFPRPCIPA
ncbi:hypothetical protein PR048_022440 [Dryococelus australis]|uniref:CD80-like immunoglobulin C2-set domain-containing protein n=1 Tax=Dryococelus australis TaxID=614101 RepID=A0ABQ9H137_9NEOP|nr:hypothetical protein PR048_022440 [Dryococelus australis]